MAEIVTSRIKYIYLDVVGFTHNRTVETQVKIVSTLNDIVKGCLTDLFPEIDVIYIPIGDGICICLLDSKEVYDDHIIIAGEIIRRISSIYNPSVKRSFQFEVRIGINENVDNIITDINDNRNVCGSGVNDAQRIMNFGDSNHILVGRSVSDSLIPRDKYSKAFRRYIGKTKHNTNIEIYQYIGGRIANLNRDPPSAFATPAEKALTEYAAYYIANLLRNSKFIEKIIEEKSHYVYALGVQMAYLAEDLLGHSKETRLSPYDNRMPKTPNNTLQEQLEFFCGLTWEVCIDLHQAKVESRFWNSYSDCFEEGSTGTFVFVSEKGRQKLENEWPEIYKEFSTQ